MLVVDVTPSRPSFSGRRRHQSRHVKFSIPRLPADKGLGPSWALLQSIENNVMCRLARESNLADRPSIPRRPSFVPPLPILPRSPAHFSQPPTPASVPYPYPPSHKTHNQSLDGSRPPPTTSAASYCRPIASSLSPASNWPSPQHTIPAVSPCRLAHGMPINPTPLRLLELPIAGCCLWIVPGRTQRHETIGRDKRDIGEVGGISQLLSSSSEEAASLVFLTSCSIAFD